MRHLGHNPANGTLDSEATVSLASKGELFERMARRRYQKPKPFIEGNWWWIVIRQDQLSDGRLTRKNKRVKLAPKDTSFREVEKLRDEQLRSINQGLESIGSATQFRAYVEGDYRGATLPLLASTTRDNYQYTISKYLMPIFGNRMLRELTPMMLQKYFNSLSVSHSTATKIKDAVGSVLNSAVKYGLLVKNPLTRVQIPAPRTGKRPRPHITPEQFDALVNLMSEPYATMVYMCVLAGLRVSELIGLKWEDVHSNSLTIDERYSRGDWSCPKTSASSATIGVDGRVIERIMRLKGMEVTINWGARGAKKSFKVVRSDAPGDLVFQSLKAGAPMSDHNILSRHIKPAARKLGLGWINWQVLRRSYATWMVEAGADPKAVQGQMRHSRISTTMDIYAQIVPDSQQRAVAQMMDMVTARVAKATPATTAVN
jgi:integrase